MGRYHEWYVIQMEPATQLTTMMDNLLMEHTQSHEPRYFVWTDRYHLRRATLNHKTIILDDIEKELVQMYQHCIDGQDGWFVALLCLHTTEQPDLIYAMAPVSQFL